MIDLSEVETTRDSLVTKFRLGLIVDLGWLDSRGSKVLVAGWFDSNGELFSPTELVEPKSGRGISILRGDWLKLPKDEWLAKTLYPWPNDSSRPDVIRIATFFYEIFDKFGVTAWAVSQRVFDRGWQQGFLEGPWCRLQHPVLRCGTEDASEELRSEWRETIEARFCLALKGEDISVVEYACERWVVLSRYDY